MIRDKLSPGRVRRRRGLPPTWAVAVLVITLTIIIAIAYATTSASAQPGGG